jgi:NADPH-dependent F420 reductase
MSRMSERVEQDGQPGDEAPRIAVLGGTGDQGQGLALRFAAAGLAVVIGSREESRAAEIAAALGSGIRGAANADAAAQADIVIVAVPWAAHAVTLTDLRGALAGKLVVDCVNPLGFDAEGPYALDVPEGSACQQAAELLPDSRVVGAFHHVSAVLLKDLGQSSVDTDVLVVGDDRVDVDPVIALAQRIAGVRGVYAGRLRNAGQVEALTANLIAVNRRYKAHAGLRITDV